MILFLPKFSPIAKAYFVLISYFFISLKSKSISTFHLANI